MPAWQAVIFDLDDTLFPEHEYVLSGFRAVSSWAERELGVPSNVAFSELESLFRAGVRRDTFDRWLGSRGARADLASEAVAVYRSHEPILRPFDGIPPLLHRLCSERAVGLVSDGYLAVQRRKLDALDIRQYFSAVVFSDELGREAWKPSARPFHRVLELLAVSADAAVYVADNCAKDFLGARRAGLATIWARHSGGDFAVRAPETQAHAADFTAQSMDELTELLS